MKNKNLKTLFITLPQREKPGQLPPYGAMSLITYLRKAGYSKTFLYDIDALRPSRKDALDYISSFEPDVLAISAPVSTSYENCHFFSLEIKKRLPNITIILGGNLAASAEVILRRTGVDFCFIGDGEIACTQFFDSYFPHKSKDGLHNIHGLAFLNKETLIVTGSADRLDKELIYDVDWEILETSCKHHFPKLGDLDTNYSSKGTLDPHSYPAMCFFPEYDDTKSIPTDILIKTYGTMFCSRGCVNRCTFCHRFSKGIRIIPPEIVINRVKEMISLFNLGTVEFCDECFGVDPRWLKRFCELIKPLNLLWQVGGMRARSVSPESIAMMKDAGCRTIVYGFESGSTNILGIMEKRTSLKQNLNAAKWTLDAGLHTPIQLVIGMPGETSETIKETIDFVCDVITSKKSYFQKKEISMTFAQALPGSPLYEYGRGIGKIGLTLDAEEDYLLRISDRNASDGETTINFTEYPKLTLLSWPRLIDCSLNYNYIKKFGASEYYKAVFGEEFPPQFLDLVRTRKFRLLPAKYPLAVYYLRSFFLFFVLLKYMRRNGLIVSLGLMKEAFSFYIKKLFNKKKSTWEYKSLRKIIDEDFVQPYSGSSEMIQIRKGQ